MPLRVVFVTANERVINVVVHRRNLLVPADMRENGFANFGRELDGLPALLRSRQRPKKASSYPDIYLVDDDGKHFRYGTEIHARADTARPPHNSLCVIGNCFRFGRAFDGARHFNVSRDGQARMTATYPDCHDVARSGANATHLNMFTNDFF